MIDKGPRRFIIEGHVNRLHLIGRRLGRGELGHRA